MLVITTQELIDICNMPPLASRGLSPENRIDVIFGVIASLLACIAVGFAAAAWKGQRRRTMDREGMMIERQLAIDQD